MKVNTHYFAAPKQDLAVEKDEKQALALAEKRINTLASKVDLPQSVHFMYLSNRHASGKDGRHLVRMIALNRSEEGEYKAGDWSFVDPNPNQLLPIFGHHMLSNYSKQIDWPEGIYYNPPRKDNKYLIMFEVTIIATKEIKPLVDLIKKNFKYTTNGMDFDFPERKITMRQAISEWYNEKMEPHRTRKYMRTEEADLNSRINNARNWNKDMSWRRGMVSAKEISALKCVYRTKKFAGVIPRGAGWFELQGLEDPINGFYLGPVWSDIHSRSNAHRFSMMEVKSPSADGVMKFEVCPGEREKVGTQVMKYLVNYASVLDDLHATIESPLEDTIENMKQTVKITGMDKWADELSYADRAFGYSLKQLSKEEKKDMAMTMAWVFMNRADPRRERLTRKLKRKGLLKPDA